MNDVEEIGGERREGVEVKLFVFTLKNKRNCLLCFVSVIRFIFFSISSEVKYHVFH